MAGKCELEPREIVEGKQGGTLIVCPLSLVFLVMMLVCCEVVATGDSLAYSAGSSLGVCLPQRAFQRRVG